MAVGRSFMWKNVEEVQYNFFYRLEGGGNFYLKKGCGQEYQVAGILYQGQFYSPIT